MKQISALHVAPLCLHLVQNSVLPLILGLGSVLHPILHPGIPSCADTPPHHFSIHHSIHPMQHSSCTSPFSPCRTPLETCISMHHLMNFSSGQEDLKTFHPIGSNRPEWIQSGAGLKIEDPPRKFFQGSSTFNLQSSPRLDPIGPIESNRGLDSP